ncbi:cysteine--tRNA ligase [Clostridia bacterium]|nr:cysteine--tRNA ligase [Clostridia bacterium]
MKIYNTLTKKKEEFIPLEPNQVKMYVCGPTVYDYIHIGNARPMVIFDTVRRYFEYKGYQVNYVSNFTDIDDKLIQKAKQEQTEVSLIAQHFILTCKQDMESLNIRPATVHPLATNEMDSIIEMITMLIQKGYAYPKEGTVYFRTKKFSHYGSLSHKNLEDLQSGNRTLLVSGVAQKEDPLDFVLWKPKKEGEPFWSSTWSEGRPGWHIECSAMCKKYLGDQIDIHAGGEDLIFPHHENEIAQSEALSETQFARYWMHNAFLNINHKKMAKSEKNFFTVREIAEKYSGNILRFFLLNAHYRSPLNFSEDLMLSAKNALERLITGIEKLSTLEAQNLSPDLQEKERNDQKQLHSLIQKYEQAMEDDFNTADAIAAIFECIKLSNSTANQNSSLAYVKECKTCIVQLCSVLGIDTERANEILDEEIEELIAQRTQARKEKNFTLADDIRKQLEKMDIILEDTRNGVVWKRL